MRRFLLLLLVLPLLAGACGDDATEDTPDPPATTLPAGTRDDPFGVGKSVTVSGLPDKLLIGLAANSGDSRLQRCENQRSDGRLRISGRSVPMKKPHPFGSGIKRA